MRYSGMAADEGDIVRNCGISAKVEEESARAERKSAKAEEKSAKAERKSAKVQNIYQTASLHLCIPST
ncbi:hypothetical protein HRF69_12120 [Bacillus circulans]|uniref:hypothetical protein n=1 Tax=Niallia circulans TaxID=1397 RepID=UPI0015613734|nr:hypothetical protein [Niallia circulans]NRG27862.1 hypothetical protein [Niallia circulans]